MPIGETMSAMDRLVQDEMVRFIGVSNFSVAQFGKAQAVTSIRIVSNQVLYSLANRGIELDTLPYCQEVQDPSTT
jgi:aryl-alcohol dehydrogenase-like predicted oxidoreductase